MSTEISTKSKTPVYITAIQKAEPIFRKQSYAGLMNYNEEAGHAVEVLAKNTHSIKVAQNNPNSVRRAVIKVASIGLSLNPALGYAYLVPRDAEICLDISYKGLVKLATDSGAIKWAKAEIVKDNDDFKYNGICALPDHSFDPFGERGKTKGVFCVAKTADGDFLVDVMSLDEINTVRNSSKSKDSSYSPWQTFYDEMAKKTIIKRAQKMWPKGSDNRLETAIHHLNEHEGLEKTESVDSVQHSISSASIKALERGLEMMEEDTGEFLSKNEVGDLSELSENRAQELLVALRVRFKAKVDSESKESEEVNY